MRAGALRIVFQQRFGRLARGAHQRLVAFEVREAQQRSSALALAQHLARTAQQQVPARDLEAVLDILQDEVEETALDVAAALRYGVEHGLRIAVRGGGHNGGGLGSVDDGLVIELSQMNAISVGPGAAQAPAGGGGLRLEDNFLVTETGCEKLCSYPDDFRVFSKADADQPRTT